MSRDFDIKAHDQAMRELDAEADRLLAIYRARQPTGRPEEVWPFLFGQSGDDHLRWLRTFFAPLRTPK